MLKLFDPFDALEYPPDEQVWLSYRSTDLATELGVNNSDMKDAVNRAMNACAAMDIQVARNFRKHFTGQGHDLEVAWELSPLACYLIIVNFNPDHPLVARAQVYFAELNKKNKHEHI